MRRLTLLLLTVAIGGMACPDRIPKSRPNVDLVEPIIKEQGKTREQGKEAGVTRGNPVIPETTPAPAEVVVTLPDQDKYEAALLKAVDFLADRRYPEALAALEEA